MEVIRINLRGCQYHTFDISNASEGEKKSWAWYNGGEGEEYEFYGAPNKSFHINLLWKKKPTTYVSLKDCSSNFYV
jgi:hypothetical protein